MKKMNQILLSVFILSITLCSCVKSGGDKFIGTWQNQKGAKIIISAAGETAYTVKIIGPRDEYGVAFSSTTTTTYLDGNLVSAGKVICSYSNDKIILNGEEFAKSEGENNSNGQKMGSNINIEGEWIGKGQYEGQTLKIQDNNNCEYLTPQKTYTGKAETVEYNDRDLNNAKQIPEILVNINNIISYDKGLNLILMVDNKEDIMYLALYTDGSKLYASGGRSSYFEQIK